jgi:hypothetical protein
MRSRIVWSPRDKHNMNREESRLVFVKATLSLNMVFLQSSKYG